MKGKFLKLFLIFVFAACASATSKNAVNGAVVVPEAEGSYSFGEVYAGEIVRAPFLIVNPSPDRLIIDEVNTNCGCTTTNLEGAIIRPHESLLVWVQFDTKNQWGPQSKTVTLMTDAPYRQSIKLKIEGVVRPRLQFEPVRIKASIMQAQFETRVAVKNISDHPVVIKAIAIEPETPIKVGFDNQTLPLTLSAGTEALLVIQTELTHPGAIVAASILLQLDEIDVPLRLPIYVQRTD